MLISGSRLPVGSSAMMNLGPCTSARATATRCCSPPESSSGRRSILSSSPTRDRAKGTRDLMCLVEMLVTRMANATFSYTVMVGMRRKSWNTTPISRRRNGTFLRLILFRFCPLMVMVPPVARSSICISLMKVDLPAPEWPSTQTNSPSSICRLMSSSATFSELCVSYVLETCSKSIITLLLLCYTALYAAKPRIVVHIITYHTTARPSSFFGWHTTGKTAQTRRFAPFVKAL